jgi:hypothetical protein
MRPLKLKWRGGFALPHFGPAMCYFSDRVRACAKLARALAKGG